MKWKENDMISIQECHFRAHNIYAMFRAFQPYHSQETVQVVPKGLSRSGAKSSSFFIQNEKRKKKPTRNGTHGKDHTEHSIHKNFNSIYRC